MSIPKGRTSYFGRYDNKEAFRLVPQYGIRFIEDPAKTGYASCWDMNVSPFDGTLYAALCWEGGHDAHARLVAYDYDRDEAKIACKIEELTLPNRRQLPHSKLHESMSFLPDGRLIATTHNTDYSSMHQKEWMPFAHVDHAHEGFAGSAILIYDPKTGITQNMGVPVPRETIYGGTYDPKYNAFYMIGFMRGHIYRYSLDDKSVKDLGKAAEVYCYRLHTGPDGHIYGMTKSGFLFRVNVDTQEIEDLHWRLPAYPDNFVDNTWYRYMSQAHDISDHEFVFMTTAGEDVYCFDTNTQTCRSLGKRAPADSVNSFHYVPWCIDEFGVDKYGALWYILQPWAIDHPVDEFYDTTSAIILVRFDPKSGKGAECMGIFSTQDARLNNASCVCLDAKRDRFYLIGTTKPVTGKKGEEQQAIWCLDLAEFRKHIGEQGPIWEQDMKPVPWAEEKVAETKRKAMLPPDWAGEEVSGNNPYAEVPVSHVVPIRLWRALADRNLPIEESRVQGLAWDGDAVHGVCGTKNKYYFRIVPRKTAYFASKAEADSTEEVWVWRSILKARIVEREENGKWAIDVPTAFSYVLDTFKPYDELTVGEAKALDATMAPGPIADLNGAKLPEVAGRRYLSYVTATCKLPDGRIAAGTADAMFATIKDGKVFSYGNAAPLGPVRCLSLSADGKRVYGTAGDDDDMGTVFTFDDERGLHQMGLINYNSPGWMDGPTASNVLSAVAPSPDGKLLAVGSADRIGAVHILIL